MTWFFSAFLAATFYSMSILLDKSLLSKQFKKVSELSLTTAAALAGIIPLIIFLLIVDTLPNLRMLLQGFAAGWLLMAAFQLYYVALRRSDAALITILAQLILVFNFISGILLFDERPPRSQIAGLILIIIAVIVVSLDQKEKRWRINPSLILLMTGMAALVTLSDIVFKTSAETAPFLTLSVAEYASTITAGVILYAFLPKVRKELKTVRKNLTSATIALEINEVLTLLGTLFLRYSLVIGPIALVQGMMGLQPFMVLGLTSLFAFFGILKIKESLKREQVILRVISALIMLAGAYLITNPVV